MNERLRITAQRHSYWDEPVSAVLRDPALGRSGAVSLLEAHTGRRIPAQVVADAKGAVSVCWILDELARDASREYEIVGEPASEQGRDVGLTDTGSQVEVRVGGDLFTTYHYGSEVIRPYLYPLIGPGGRNVTRHYPMKTDVPGETSDHVHHRSVWIAHGDVNGSDNWSEAQGHGTQKHKGFGEITSGPVLGRLRCMNDWLDNDGRKVMQEEREITVFNLPEDRRLIDFRIALGATEGDVHFGDTKEGGILAVRVASSMDGNKGGLITNSFGGITEVEAWGKPAHWCDYSGSVDGHALGVTIFDNPGNFRHPTYWHVRDYGLMTANPFALSAYKNDPGWDGGHTVPAGTTFQFAYRLYIHDGNAQMGQVAEKYHGYINSPFVEQI